jgi:hypothetical protein
MSILEAIPVSLPLVDALVAAPPCKIATPWLIKIDKYMLGSEEFCSEIRLSSSDYPSWRIHEGFDRERRGVLA